MSRSLVLARNPTMFGFGLDYQFYQNLTAVKQYIAFLEKEFDLVMIMEYFEESMVLMKCLLFWEFEDFFTLNLMRDWMKKELQKWVTTLKRTSEGGTKLMCYCTSTLTEHFGTK